MTLAHEAKDLFLPSFCASIEKSGDTELLRRLRREAWHKLQQVGLPKSKNDLFQYISLAKVIEKSYRYPENKELVPPHPLTGSSRSYVVFVNGNIRLDLSGISALPKGCVVKPLQEAAKTYATLLSNHFSEALKQENDPFALLTMACYQDGLFLYIPPKIIVETPIEIIHVIDCDEESAVLPRIYLCMGAHAELKMTASVFLRNAHELFSSMLFEAYLEEGAHVSFVETMHGSGTGMIMNALRAYQKRSSTMRSIQITHGNIPIRSDLKASLAGEGAEVDLSGLWVAASHAECHTNVLVEHKEPNTHSNQMFKGVLFDQARSSFQGKIYVHQKAQKTLAYQLNNNLVLSDEAQANSKPNLEIFADDVKASHGATVGQLDQEQLFYLRTRGFSEKEARSVLIEGFCEEIAQQITIPSLQEKVEQMIAAIVE